LSKDFEVIGFMAPFAHLHCLAAIVFVRRLSADDRRSASKCPGTAATLFGTVNICCANCSTRRAPSHADLWGAR
jgi:hypothetical protein